MRCHPGFHCRGGCLLSVQIDTDRQTVSTTRQEPPTTTHPFLVSICLQQLYWLFLFHFLYECCCFCNQSISRTRSGRCFHDLLPLIRQVLHSNSFSLSLLTPRDKFRQTLIDPRSTSNKLHATYFFSLYYFLFGTSPYQTAEKHYTVQPLHLSVLHSVWGPTNHSIDPLVDVNGAVRFIASRKSSMKLALIQTLKAPSLFLTHSKCWSVHQLKRSRRFMVEEVVKLIVLSPIHSARRFAWGECKLIPMGVARDPSSADAARREDFDGMADTPLLHSGWATRKILQNDCLLSWARTMNQILEPKTSESETRSPVSHRGPDKCDLCE